MTAILITIGVILLAALLGGILDLIQLIIEMMGD